MMLFREGVESGPTWQRAALVGLGLFLLTRIAVIGWAYLVPQDRTQANVTWWPNNPLVRWDSGHYAGICNEGYPREINDTTAFFPAYPLFCRVLNRWINTDDALVITSNIFSVLAFGVFCSLAVRQCGTSTAIRAVVLLSVFPSAYFFSAGYAEGLFVACAAVALLALQRRNLWIAALASAIATATRPPGIAIALVVFFEAIRFYTDRAANETVRPGRFSKIKSLKPTQWTLVLTIGITAVSGLIAHACFLAWHYDRWDAYFAAQQTWSPGEVRRPWLKILTLHPLLADATAPLTALFSGDPARLLAHNTWDGLLGLAILIVGVRGLFARDWNIPRFWFLIPVVTFLLAYLPDPASGARLYGISRYELAALPCFLRIADWDLWQKRPRFFVVVCLAMFVLQLANVAAFVNWQEAG